MKKKAIIKGTLVNGDGKSEIEDSLVLIEEGIITYAGKEKDFERQSYEIVDASDMILIPGIINSHAHGIVPYSPLFSSGSKPLDVSQIISNQRMHLSQGTTTILSVDGFASPDDVAEACRMTEMDVFAALCHFPKSYTAARIIDGSGISKKIDCISSLENIAAIGECGSGATLGGGVQDYKFIPEMIRNEYGVNIGEDTARQIKEAVLGRKISGKNYDSEKLAFLIEQSGISDSCESLKQKIINCVIPSFSTSLQSLEESAEEGARAGLPVIMHSSAASMETIRRIANGRYNRGNIIAGHSNHPSYNLEEALKFAEQIKKKKVFIDISTFDSLNTGNKKEIDYFMAFLESGLVDTVSTDYGGGNHSSIIQMIDFAVQENAISFPEAVRLFTYNPSVIFPRMRDRGIIAEGYMADMVFLQRKKRDYITRILIRGEDAGSSIQKTGA